MSVVYKSEAGAAEIRRRYEEALRSWPVAAEQLRVPTREGETFVLVSGPRDAPPLVLLHGAGANATTWLDDVAAWSERFRVHAVDVVGEPGLSAPSRPALDSDASALWLGDVLDGLGIERTAIVGASLGGWIALDYSTRQPERVTHLGLLCPGGLGRQKTGWLFKTLLLRPFGRWGARRSTAAVAGLHAREHRPVVDQLVFLFKEFKPRTERLPLFSDDALGRLTMPVLVIVGGNDAMFDSWDTVRRVRKRVPQARMNVLPEAGHAILGQTAAVERFLSGLTTPAATGGDDTAQS
ncbi:alpha/beta fold hydrolase [Streptomyces otsuchiensis]|uniref:alpha/beta fold hydrolase n=1 Tax=Streptomyces otsuchiensis TaxID=2681388 RepID=UPI001030C370|nr:alpha/beta hydrolase [Streptomyces otsuchiensis]